MFLDTSKSIYFVTIVAVANILLAFIYGSNGYEAFVTLSIVLAIMFTWQLVQAANRIFHSKSWLIFKILALPVLMFCWFLIVIAEMLSIFKPSVAPGVVIPPIHLWLIVIGSASYFLPRNTSSVKEVSVTQLTIRAVATLFSIMTLFIAALDFYDNSSALKNVILVIAIELQYIMNYVVLKTNYLGAALNLATRITQKLHLDEGELGFYLIMFLVGLPFFAPFIAIIAIGWIR